MVLSKLRDKLFSSTIFLRAIRIPLCVLRLLYSGINAISVATTVSVRYRGIFYAAGVTFTDVPAYKLYYTSLLHTDNHAVPALRQYKITSLSGQRA